jgi:hypothetical protein
MKKTLSAMIIALLFCAGPLMSQKQLYFGLSGTGLSSIITNQNNYGLGFEMDYAATFGAAGNVNIGFDFSNHIGLKLEVGFANLGQKYEDTRMENDTNVRYTRNVQLNYLQIPLLFKFRTGGEVVKFYVMAGPQLNYLLSATQKYLRNDMVDDRIVPGSLEEIGKETITDRYNSIDIIGRIDLGVDIQLAANLFLNAGMSMGYGLTDINASDWQYKDSDGNYNPSHNIYGGLNVGINYTLPIGSK